jgi:hypothetical protein
MDDLNWTAPKEPRHIINVNGKRSTFKWFEWALFIITTVRLTSIDHPQIEGGYISGLRAANFIFLVCVESSSEWRTPQQLDLLLARRIAEI